MTQEEIKDEVARNYGYVNWKLRNGLHTEEMMEKVAFIYATECVKASLERAAENAKLITMPGNLMDYEEVNKSSITDPKNIVLL